MELAARIIASRDGIGDRNRPPVLLLGDGLLTACRSAARPFPRAKVGKTFATASDSD
jgi:hypothetical protein